MEVILIWRQNLGRTAAAEQAELIQLIKKYAENGFQEKAEYAEMRKNYFAYIDHNNCERTYEYIKSRVFKPWLVSSNPYINSITTLIKKITITTIMTGFTIL